MNDYFDDFLCRTKEFAKCSSQKVGEIAEITKLKFQTLNLETDLNVLYRKLGKEAYQNIPHIELRRYVSCDLLDCIKEKCCEIARIEDKLAGLSDECCCHACGKNVPKHTDYCCHCGEKMC